MLVLLLAAQTARLLWMLVTPLAPLGEPIGPRAPRAVSPPADLSALERFAASSAPVVAVAAAPVIVEAPPPTISGFRLHGVRSSIAGDGGAAILSGPDGVQASYRRGQSVAPGVTLAAIGREAVTLSGAAGSVRLAIGADAAVPMAPPQPVAPAPSAVPTPSAASLGFQVPSPTPQATPQ